MGWLVWTDPGLCVPARQTKESVFRKRKSRRSRVANGFEPLACTRRTSISSQASRFGFRRIMSRQFTEQMKASGVELTGLTSVLLFRKKNEIDSLVRN